MSILHNCFLLPDVVTLLHLLSRCPVGQGSMSSAIVVKILNSPTHSHWPLWGFCQHGGPNLASASLNFPLSLLCSARYMWPRTRATHSRASGLYFFLFIQDSESLGDNILCHMEQIFFQAKLGLGLSSSFVTSCVTWCTKFCPLEMNEILQNWCSLHLVLPECNDSRGKVGLTNGFLTFIDSGSVEQS